uniref:Uncharacterized protein n=1 Tax=Oryza rufipogon TaxID=4529 RepID=A0A0E0N785_ORYRU
MSSVVVASTPTVLPLQSRPATHSRSSGKTLLLGPSPLPHPASATQGHMVRGVCSGQDFHFCIDEQTQGCIARFQAGTIYILTRNDHLSFLAILILIWICAPLTEKLLDNMNFTVWITLKSAKSSTKIAHSTGLL